MPRLPQDPRKVPAKVYGDLKVKNTVVAGVKERLAGICLSEMQQVYMCLKQFSFNQAACNQEITAFKSCYNKHVVEYKNKKAAKATGHSSVTKINELLKKYPERSKPS